MHFSYNDYKTFCYGAPLFGVVAFSIVVLTHGIWLACVAWTRKWNWRKNGLHLLLLIALGGLVCVLTRYLLNGGIYLRDEKETNAVEIQGEISDIKGLGDFTFPVVKGNYLYEEKNGYEFTIDGVRCKGVNKGSLEVGDYVTVRYLPKSGYILYIAETDRNTADIE